jgi:hypothetical protein
VGEVWLTYQELADKLGVTVEGARRRVQRGRWARQTGNDGRARVRVPEDVALERRPNVTPDVAPNVTPNVPPNVAANSAGGKSAPDGHLIAALEGHVETLKAELQYRAAEIEALKAKLADEAARTGQAVAAVEAHVATLKADLAGAEARASEESAKTAQAIAAFESLAQRLEAMAAARRPWWRRLTG